MNKALWLCLAIATVASARAFAETHYMVCLGGGRTALYYSTVFPVPAEVKTTDMARAFIAFVKSKYGTMIAAECHSNMTQANAESDKKIREDSDQNSKFPSKLIETDWAGK